MSRWLTQIRLIFRFIFSRNRVDQELDEEIQYHLQREIDEGLNTGFTREEAEFAVRRAMGATAKNKEECRDMRRVNLIGDLSRDLRYAVHSLRRGPFFAVLAVLIMAVGIGANTAVFSVVNGVLLKPLPYPGADRIVTLTTRNVKTSAIQSILSSALAELTGEGWIEAAPGRGTFVTHAIVSPPARPFCRRLDLRTHMPANRK